MERASLLSIRAPSLPGITGQPAFFAVSLAWALSPMRRMTLEEGPINLMVQLSHCSANSGFSERNP